LNSAKNEEQSCFGKWRKEKTIIFVSRMFSTPTPTLPEAGRGLVTDCYRVLVFKDNCKYQKFFLKKRKIILLLAFNCADAML
jgi:hypothetical protein